MFFMGDISYRDDERVLISSHLIPPTEKNQSWAVRVNVLSRETIIDTFEMKLSDGPDALDRVRERARQIAADELIGLLRDDLAEITST